MQTTTGDRTATTHPSGDKRFKILDSTMKRHRHDPASLLEVLHSAQELFGYLDIDTLLYVAHSLKLPPSRVFGVATFYNFFSLKPKGEHTCVVCMGTACYVKGTAAILAAVERACGIKAGETTSDGKVSVVTARCIGACGLAPALVFDDQIAGGQTVDSTLQRVKGWTDSER